MIWKSPREHPMSATKRHLENLTEKHGFYAASDCRERTAYRNAVLDCCARLLEAMESAKVDDVTVISDCVGNLHAMYDELQAVSVWKAPTV